MDFETRGDYFSTQRASFCNRNSVFTARYDLKLYFCFMLFLFFQNLRSASGVQLPSYSISRFPPPCVKAAGARDLTAQIHLMPGLRMSGFIPPVPLYNRIAQKGKTLPLRH
jgi:hypothetical protein